MNGKLKILFIYTFLAIVNFVVNFAIYNYSFNKQATPYLHEEQRVESGLMMLKTTLPAYLVSAMLLTFVFYVTAKYIITKSSSGR
ncbi:MAG: hypothetical protein L0Z73_17975 [Gammaproteobacteria bacterium]|nr:hypothetical protein [Gammaproteobacteria bacterium]